jgi:hypothetical protein
METTGGSMAGYSRIGSFTRAAMPSTISIRLMTVAKTGRLMETSESTMAWLPHSAGRNRHRNHQAEPPNLQEVGRVIVSVTRTGASLRRRWMPRTTTGSPASRPVTTSTSPRRRWPRRTSTRFARLSRTT